jgi:protein TonB
MHLPSLSAAHSRAWLAFGISLALHGAVLGGWRPFTISAPRISAFEPIEVSLIGSPAPRYTPAPRPTPRPMPLAKAADTPAAPATPAREQSGENNTSDTPLVEARSDVASLNNPRPAYPLAARRRGIEGRVLLAAHVNAEGDCTEVRLKRSSGHALLDEAALGSVRHWRFIPARRGNHSVDSWVDVPVSFRLEGAARHTL